MEVNDTAWDVQRALLDFLEAIGATRITAYGRFVVRLGNSSTQKVMTWAEWTARCTVENHHLDGPLDKWRQLRRQIHDDVCTNGYDAERNTFTPVLRF